jgi:hypothetical protein
MAKAFHIFTAGIAVALVASSLVSCSTGSKPTASDTAPAQSAADDAAAPNSSANSKEFRVVDNAELPQPGTDPMAMVFGLRKPDSDPLGSEQIKVTYPDANKAVVFLTANGLKDDSVSAKRTRYDFESEASSDGTKAWKVVKVSEQNKCQPGRGPQEWTGELCN